MDTRKAITTDSDCDVHIFVSVLKTGACAINRDHGGHQLPKVYSKLLIDAPPDNDDR